MGWLYSAWDFVEIGIECYRCVRTHLTAAGACRGVAIRGRRERAARRR